ncbi:MAG TPA: hypothetical protein VNR18_06245, partial [Hyphomicrobiales bacterium]|nr:hypothetical protein [Hyphomicrobiales bacterium]
MPQSNRQQALESVLRNASVWRAEQVARDAPAGISTTHSALDQALPDAGWPLGALTELLCEQTGIGELFLLLPALRALCADGRGIALI